MFKVYKRTLHIGRTDEGDKLQSSVFAEKVINANKQPLWSRIPAIIASTLVAGLALSLIFAAILLPLGLLGLAAWLRYRKMQKNTPDQTIEAEYTVISEADSKSTDERF